MSIDIVGTRAVSQTKMTINQRALVDEVECDVVCIPGAPWRTEEAG
jgi:hypothetical protein